MAGHEVFEPDFQGFRFYNEDGTELTATVLANEDTNINVDVTSADVQIQMRAMVQEVGDGSISGETTDDYGLQYNKNVSGNVDVTDVSSDIRANVASGLTDGSATTNRATDGVADGTGSFVAGEQEAGDAVVDDMQLTGDNFTEHVWTLELVSADLADTDSIVLRMTLNGGNPGMTNTVAPTITITKSGGAIVNQTHYRFQDDGADANTSTLLGSEDTANESLSLDTNYFIRIKVANVGGASADNYLYRLEYNVDGAGWNAVSSASVNVRLIDGGDTDGDAMTVQRLTNDGGTYQNGVYEEVGDTAAFTLAANFETEIVFAITFRSADLTAFGEQIDLRLTNAGVVLDNYTVIAEATMPIEVVQAVSSWYIDTQYSVRSKFL